MSTIHPDLSAVLKFWFKELWAKDWWSGSEKVDQKIRDRFFNTHAKVVAGTYQPERTSPEAYLAEVIVLDQFSRNLFRGSQEAYAYDELALTLAKEAISLGYDEKLPKKQRAFLYMPFMHSESRAVHEDGLRLFEELGNRRQLKYEKVHKKIIDRFGRYPHRNAVLGRPSTPEEVEYLNTNHEDFF